MWLSLVAGTGTPVFLSKITHKCGDGQGMLQTAGECVQYHVFGMGLPESYDKNVISSYESGCCSGLPRGRPCVSRLRAVPHEKPEGEVSLLVDDLQVFAAGPDPGECGAQSGDQSGIGLRMGRQPEAFGGDLRQGHDLTDRAWRQPERGEDVLHQEERLI